MRRTHEERINAHEAATTRKREIITMLGMDPDEVHRIKRPKDCTRLRRERIHSRDLIAAYKEECEEIVA
jgi:hypothetical protein